MTHDALREHIEARLVVARAAIAVVGDHWYGDGEYIGAELRSETAINAHTILHGPWGYLGDELAAFLLAHEPDDAIRRHEAALRMLDMHDGEHECPSEDDNCGWWVVTCPTLKILATSYGVVLDGEPKGANHDDSD